MYDEQPVMGEAKRIDRFIAVIAFLGLATLAVSVWLAFNIKVETSIEIDEVGLITVEGPEEDFVGDLRAESANWKLELRGLPDPDAVAENPRARYAICAARDDPDAVWGEPSATLRVHLHSERFNRLCSVYPAL